MAPRRAFRTAPLVPAIADLGVRRSVVGDKVLLPIRVGRVVGQRVAADGAGVEADPLIMRGGDGGSSSCGCMGDLATWLTLASPYVCREVVEQLGDVIYGGHVRRVYPLA